MSPLDDSAFALRDRPALQTRGLLMAEGKSDRDLGEEQADQTVWLAPLAKHTAG